MVVSPLIGRGFVLTYDMVFVPRPPLSDALLGLSSQYPRSVPTAMLVALASRVVPGEILQKVILLAIFAGAALGAARLVPASRPVGRVAAGVLYAWNPMVYERLLLGQWALLLGYAILPWVAVAALRYVTGRGADRWRLILWLAAAAAASPYTGVFGALTALAIAVPGAPGGRRWRRAAAVVGMAILVNLPWLVPSLLHPPVPQRPEVAALAFQARSDSPLGAVGSLLSLGGLWRPDLSPPGRGTLAWLPAWAIILLIGAAGFRELDRRWPRRARAGLVALAALGLALAAAPTVSSLRGISVWLSTHLPGGGILRDSQKFIIPFALLVAISFGVGIDVVMSRFHGHRLAAALWVTALLPVALAPTLAWGAGGRLFTATYPESWPRAERIMAGDHVGGAALVLPWHTYLPLSWNRGRTVLEPATDYFSRRVVADGTLVVGPYRLPAEDRYAGRATPLVTGTGPLTPGLRSLGVRYVVVLKEVDWRRQVRRLAGSRVLDEPDMALYRLPRPGPERTFPTPPALPVIAGDTASATFVTVAAVGSITGRRRRKGSGARDGPPVMLAT